MALNFYFGVIVYNILTISLILMILYRIRIKSQDKIIFNFICCLSIFLIGWLGNIIFPDYYEYERIIKIVTTTKDPFVHIESFWTGLIRCIGNNHLMFNFIIQLVSCCILFTISIQYKPQSLTIFYGSLMSIAYYSLFGGRGILFSMLFFLGYAFLSQKKYFLAVIVLIACFPIHKASYFAYPLLLLSILSANRLFVKYSTIFIIIVCICLRFTINNFIQENELLLTQLPGYNYILQEENKNIIGNAIWAIIPKFINTIKYALFIYVIIKLSKIRGLLSRTQQWAYRLLYWGTICSLGYYIIGLPDPTIATRCLGLAYVPFCFIISCYTQFFKIKGHKISTYCLLLFILLLLYDLYIVRVYRINNIESII